MPGDRILVMAAKPKILRVLQEEHCVTRGRLVKRTNIQRGIIDRALRALRAEGAIEIREVPRTWPSFNDDIIYRELVFPVHTTVTGGRQ